MCCESTPKGCQIFPNHDIPSGLNFLHYIFYNLFTPSGLNLKVSSVDFSQRKFLQRIFVNRHTQACTVWYINGGI